MRNSFKVSFFIKKNQLLKNGDAAVSLRITVNGQREELRTKKSINPALWSQAKECSRARDKVSRDLNEYILNSKMKLINIYQELEESGKAISATILKNKFFGMDNEDRKTLIAFFNEHNEKCRQLIGIDYVDITVRRYECCARYLKELIQKKYGEDDLLLREVKGELVRDFEFFMKTEKGCQQNTFIRYMKCFKKVINLAIANEYITRNPFAGIKFHEVPVNKEFLTLEELNRLSEKEFKIDRLELVRDVFLFCCFTGLAFIDVYNLRKEHLVTDNKGNLWILKTREKTSNMCNIPLLTIPKEILDKYEEHPLCQLKGVLLPVMCNQKMNDYLREIGEICGIDKKITFHTARHTAALVVFLANDVSLPNVAKMLGHFSTRMTQHYAKVLDSSIIRDMKNVDAISFEFNHIESSIFILKKYLYIHLLGRLLAAYGKQMCFDISCPVY
ncbi:site-specific integrase [Prevotella sp. 10(H)]|uniref:site-specific integrase n=1 Tax=Prevotella sp. 10(H) TaxID=1158294 RepID=UPI0009E00B44|nr:site-specific integrase [Prevotella sp. 10(H)]